MAEPSAPPSTRTHPSPSWTRCWPRTVRLQLDLLDVTLVDIDLGEESGLDLAYRLTTNPNIEASQVILISAYSEMDYADLIAASPAIGFLSKSELSSRSVQEALAGNRRL